MAHPIWPLFDLRVTTDDLELRYLDDAACTELALLAAQGIHDPDTMPFVVPWTDFPSPILERQAMQYFWTTRASTSPEKWDLLLGAYVDGALVGTTGLHTSNFSTTRRFETGSWLGRAFQGTGIGTKMRRATLYLGFVGLDALVATTSAFEHNAASLGVTRKLGYQQIGETEKSPRGTPQRSFQFELDRETFLRDNPLQATLHGVEATRHFLQISAV
jgi:RimJ/RimL family protein N-acetyltransferase